MPVYPQRFSAFPNPVDKGACARFRLQRKAAKQGSTTMALQYTIQDLRAQMARMQESMIVQSQWLSEVVESQRQTNMAILEAVSAIHRSTLEYSVRDHPPQPPKSLSALAVPFEPLCPVAPDPPSPEPSITHPEGSTVDRSNDLPRSKTVTPSSTVSPPSVSSTLCSPSVSLPGLKGMFNRRPKALEPITPLASASPPSLPI
ncbi:hypothetical protein PQX77_002390 [Marasmius sp. AFHP31]|nr:hypothetical protein PQX77_002390 [Marasmius sp. AFHP31]